MRDEHLPVSRDFHHIAACERSNMASETEKAPAATIETETKEKLEDEGSSKNKMESTVADPELLVKHPLQNTWALWFFKNDRSKDWNENLKLVAKFQFIEDFWGLYNYIQPASRLPGGCDYSVFKDGIQPAWEDEQNKKGGRWLINLNKNQRAQELDNFWLETLLCLIGEAFEEHSDEVCGAVVNIRNKGDKLALWTSDASKREATMKIGRKLKERLNVPVKLSIAYQLHDDTMTKSGSVTRNHFQV